MDSKTTERDTSFSDDLILHNYSDDTEKYIVFEKRFTFIKQYGKLIELVPGLNF